MDLCYFITSLHSTVKPGMRVQHAIRDAGSESQFVRMGWWGNFHPADHVPHRMPCHSQQPDPQLDVGIGTRSEKAFLIHCWARLAIPARPLGQLKPSDLIGLYL